MTFTEEEIQDQKDFIQAMTFQIEAICNQMGDLENTLALLKEKRNKSKQLLDVMVANKQPKEPDVQ